jgi:hypothetical protein
MSPYFSSGGPRGEPVSVLRHLTHVYVFLWLISGTFATVIGLADQRSIILPYSFLTLHAAFRRREMKRDWMAWDCRGFPIDVEV